MSLNVYTAGYPGLLTMGLDLTDPMDSKVLTQRVSGTKRKTSTIAKADMTEFKTVLLSSSHTPRPWTLDGKQLPVSWHIALPLRRPAPRSPEASIDNKGAIYFGKALIKASFLNFIVFRCTFRLEIRGRSSESENSALNRADRDINN
ncbi:hypothetical protein PDE_09330 [Penicillium oxalicum 114-2]|uniref:Uncharacterized protein n=1 Tax=Penicillium oxalicum (strain 114-2 / CGMCC 5302) TaxID=933388 RepID=S7ZZW6_PENO1|nr:hypothetical protein PDE_09330 [Penicillium oxalicum 114-2]